MIKDKKVGTVPTFKERIMENIKWHAGEVTYEDRCKLLKQKGLVVWFTGLSGSGKSTIAVGVESKLTAHNHAVYRLDGDNIRTGLNADLGFTEEARIENNRRVSEVAKLFKDAGIITMVAFISPLKSMRAKAKEIIGAENCIEVFIKADIEECKKRDPKGLYQKALKGEIENFTGISSAYEEPDNPDIVIDTNVKTIDQCVEEVLEEIRKRL